MLEYLERLAALCSPAGAAAGGWLLAGMLLAGMAGSAAHCSLMCGPFVLAQMGARLRAVPAARLCEQSRLREALLAPYHAGRIITYAAIGAAAASAGGIVAGRMQAVLGILLLFGALLLLGQAAARLRPGLHWNLLPQGAGWTLSLRRLTEGVDVTRPGGALLLGLALGGLPCMFLYSAVMIAASTGSAGGGALAMAAFGLGTVPMLVLIGFAGHQARQRWSGAWTKLAPLLLLANAAMLAVMAWRQLALTV